MQTQHNVMCTHLMLEHPKDQPTISFNISHDSQ
jgi:hypothetical protein